MLYLGSTITSKYFTESLCSWTTNRAFQILFDVPSFLIAKINLPLKQLGFGNFFNWYKLPCILKWQPNDFSFSFVRKFFRSWIVWHNHFGKIFRLRLSIQWLIGTKHVKILSEPFIKRFSLKRVERFSQIFVFFYYCYHSPFNNYHNQWPNSFFFNLWKVGNIFPPIIRTVCSGRYIPC